jgi:hypothetical protein
VCARRQSAPYIREAAAQGIETYYRLLDGEEPKLRVPAAFSLQTCKNIAGRIRERLPQEREEHVGPHC